MHLVRHPTSISVQANVASSRLALVATHSPFSPSCYVWNALLSSVVHLTEIDYPGVLWRLTVTGNSQGLKSAVCEVGKRGFEPSYASESSYQIGLMWSVRCCRLAIRGPDCKEVIFAVGSDLQLLSTLRNIFQKCWKDLLRMVCAHHTCTPPGKRWGCLWLSEWHHLQGSRQSL